MYQNNSFVTLTYSDEYLPSPRLYYPDFQGFMKRLRRRLDEPVAMMVTGEYGAQTKRPHWHAIIFGWRPNDCVLKYSNDRGDKIYSSECLSELWGKGICDLGAVTIHSASYVARYAAKKLVHGHDDDHDFHPISKKSSKYAIGKKFLESYWPDIFNIGKVILRDGDEMAEAPIPRYYEKWLKEKHPAAWVSYVTRLKLERITKAQEMSDKEREEYLQRCYVRYTNHKSRPLTANEVKKQIQDAKFSELQAYLKL